MYLGQMHSGTDAVAYFQKVSGCIDRVFFVFVETTHHMRRAQGLVLLEGELQQVQEGEGSQALRCQMASALCSVAELYMTDLWYVKACAAAGLGNANVWLRWRCRC